MAFADFGHERDVALTKLDKIALSPEQGLHYLEILVVAVQNQFADHEEWKRIVDAISL